MGVSCTGNLTVMLPGADEDGLNLSTASAAVVVPVFFFRFGKPGTSGFFPEETKIRKFPEILLSQQPETLIFGAELACIDHISGKKGGRFEKSESFRFFQIPNPEIPGKFSGNKNTDICMLKTWRLLTMRGR